MRFAVVIVMLGLARVASADPKPLADCPGVVPIALDTRVAADRHVTYTLDKLRVCVDKAVYPYASGRGHQLLACFVASVGGREKRFCGEGNTATIVDGYRIAISLRIPRFTDSCEVWLEVGKPPPAKTG